MSFDITKYGVVIQEGRVYFFPWTQSLDIYFDAEKEELHITSVCIVYVFKCPRYQYEALIKELISQ